jgi:RNA polymerase-interacting CarD/CdnL/TRCF family regulator
MKLFRKKDGGIVQLIDKEKMEKWTVELPLIFVEYIRSSKLDSYNDSKVKKEVENYLDEVLEDVAVPRLIRVLEGENNEEIIDALKRIKDIAKDNLDMTRPVKPYLEDLSNNKDKEISKLANDILDLFKKEERRKELAEKRKVMKNKEEKFLAGEISAEEYAKARKDYLTFRDNR